MKRTPRYLLLAAGSLQLGGAGLFQLLALDRTNLDSHISAGALALGLGGLIALMAARASR